MPGGKFIAGLEFYGQGALSGIRHCWSYTSLFSKVEGCVCPDLARKVGMISRISDRGYLMQGIERQLLRDYGAGPLCLDL